MWFAQERLSYMGVSCIATFARDKSSGKRSCLPNTAQEVPQVAWLR
jgi:hypothetical protein